MAHKTKKIANEILGVTNKQFTSFNKSVLRYYSHLEKARIELNKIRKDTVFKALCERPNPFV